MSLIKKYPVVDDFYNEPLLGLFCSITFFFACVWFSMLAFITEGKGLRSGDRGITTDGSFTPVASLTPAFPR